MPVLLEIGLTNAVLAALLALVVFGLTRICRRAPVVHALWLLVLIKLITPPLVSCPLAWPPGQERVSPPGLNAVGTSALATDVRDEAAPAAKVLPDEFSAALDESSTPF